MATTKIWDIKGRVDVLTNYVANPDKTQDKSKIQALHNVMDYASDDYKTKELICIWREYHARYG